MTEQQQNRKPDEQQHKEEKILDPKTVTKVSGKYIVGTYKIWDKKAKRNVTYNFRFPGYEKATGFLELVRSGDLRALYGALMKGDEDLDLPKVIQNPDIDGIQKLDWEYWEGHSKMLPVMNAAAQFLVEQLD